MDSENIQIDVPFGRVRLGDGHPTVVIAEIGINHEGDAEDCALMIRKAAEAGVDAIKLQTVDADLHYSPDSESYRVFKGAELSRDETARMFDLARSLGMEALTTVADETTIDWVDLLEPAAYKVSSGMINHIPAIRYLAGKGRTLAFSTGMAEEENIELAFRNARGAGAENLVLFQCTSLYPAPPETLHLSVIPWMRERFGIPVGFSDHSEGISAAAYATALGACVIEKHFTLDRSRSGFDHGISLNPEETAAMVRMVREAEEMRGNPVKMLGPEERKVAEKMRRYVVARREIEAGQEVSIEDLGFMRIAADQNAVPAESFEQLIGLKAPGSLVCSDPVPFEWLPKRF